MRFSFKVAGYLIVFLFLLSSCSSPEPLPPVENKVPVKDAVIIKDSLSADSLPAKRYKVNDSLDQLASIMAAMCSESALFPQITSHKVYQSYKTEFSKRWLKFDSTRV